MENIFRNDFVLGITVYYSYPFFLFNKFSYSNQSGNFRIKKKFSVHSMHSLARVPPLGGFLVSKETVVLRRWERSKQKFGFIKRVDKG